MHVTLLRPREMAAHSLLIPTARAARHNAPAPACEPSYERPPEIPTRTRYDWIIDIVLALSPLLMAIACSPIPAPPGLG